MDFSKHTARIVSRIGEPVQYTPMSGSPVTVTADFRTAPRDTFATESYSPTVTCNIDDVPLIKKGDLFDIRSDQFKVTSKEIDPVSGLVTASLEKQ